MFSYLTKSLKSKTYQSFFMSYVVFGNNIKLGFYDSLSLNISNELENRVDIVQLTDGNVLVSSGSSENSILMRRPSFCPFATLKSMNNSNLQPLKLQWIAVASVVIVQSNDGLILLTKRASHLRTFPNVWVAAGGHVDTNEDIEDAALRELLEETGLQFSRNDVDITLLCAWESAFPTILDLGMPKSHHLVLYFKVIIKEKDYNLEKLMVNVDEVQEYCWLDKNKVTAIVQSFPDPLDMSFAKDINEEIVESFESIQVKLVDSKLQHEKVLKPMSLLSSTVKDIRDINCIPERVSTGTKYALYEWLKSYKNSF